MVNMDYKTNWRLDASCTLTDKNNTILQNADFEGTQRETKETEKHIQRARMVCFSCPVRELCLEDALKQEHFDNLQGRTGMRGGFTARERFQLARARSGNKCVRCNKEFSAQKVELTDAQYKLTCSPCTVSIINDLAERYDFS